MSINIRIQSHGAQQLRGFMKGFAADIRRINERSAKRVAMKAEREAVLHITNQDLDWTANSARYQAYKVKQGHSEKTLVSTSTYLQSITSISEKGRAWVGVKKDARTADGQEVASIAAVLEYGSLRRGIPARPLWQVVLRDVAEWVRSENYFAREIIRELKAKYGGQAAGVENIITPRASVSSPQVNTGSRGGRYTVSASGRKVYQKRT